MPTAALRHAGPNELVVRVADPGSDAAQFPEFPFAEVPHGKQSWYGPIGGLWQSVYLEARAATHITRIQVTPDVQGEQAHVTVYLSQPSDSALNLTLRLTDPSGQVSSHEHRSMPARRKLSSRCRSPRRSYGILGCRTCIN